MRTIYLDHNLIRYFIRGFPSGFPADADRTALAALLSGQSDCRFVVSDWNFIEAAAEKSAKSPGEELITSYADFLLQLKPVYLPTTLAIKKAEMMGVVAPRLKLETAPPVPVFNETHSQARAVMGVTEDLLLKYTLKDFMLYLFRNTAELQQYQSPKQKVLAAQQTIRDANASGRNTPEMGSRIRREWFWSMIPERGPDKKFIPVAERRKVLEELVAEPDLVFHSCPAIWAEDLLSNVRAEALHHTPELPDAIDLMHSVPALAYCDAFVSNDRYVRTCANAVLEITGRQTIVTSSLSAALAELDGILKDSPS